MIHMLRLFVILAALLLPCAVSSAPTLVLYVATDGSDTNDCMEESPCLTIQHAVDLVPDGGLAQIYIGPGVYTAGANVTYYKVINFRGGDGSGCYPPHYVIRVPGGQTAFWIQDHAIGTMSCLYIESDGAGATGIATRQFAIGDLYYVWFGPMPGGANVLVNEMSRLSYLEGIQVLGAASHHLMVTTHSSVHIGGTVYVANGMTFAHFAYAAQLGIIDASGATLSGGLATNGFGQCNDASSLVYPPAGGFPGNLGAGC